MVVVKTILDNSNIVESYPGITLPLTTSFIETAYHGVFKGSVLRLTGDAEIARSLDRNLQHMVVNYQGRIYYNLNNWYSVLALFPLHARIMTIWRKMLGVADQDIPPPALHISALKKMRILARIRRSGASLPHEMDQLADDFSHIYDEFYMHDLATFTNDELVRLYRKLERDVLARWEVTLANDMYAFVYTWLVEKNIPDARTYLSTLANVESMRPIHALLELTELATESGEIPALHTLKTDEVVREHLATDTKFWSAMRDYIANYGDRYLEELKLESATYRTNPLLLVRAILEYADGAATLRRKLHASASTQPNTSLLNKLYLKRAVAGIKNRETSRLNRSRLYGMVREIFLHIAENLHAQGTIDNVSDIFYLTIDEVLGDDMAQAKERIANRKEQYAALPAKAPANRVILEDGKLPISSREIVRAGAMSGTPVSTGIVEGEVLVVLDPTQVASTKDKILVTRTTDPGWVFLLAHAKGIISEKGSLLSHTAIIARELSIPAVVGVPGVTEQLVTGQRVVLNGDTGTIEVKNV